MKVVFGRYWFVIFICLLSFSFDAAAQKTAETDFASNDNNVEWDGLYHDSFDSFYRTPFGAVPTGTSVTLKFRSYRFDLTGVWLRVYVLDPVTNITTGPNDFALNWVSNDATYDYWQVTYTTPSNPRLTYYKFRVVDGSDTDWYADAYSNEHDNLGQGGSGAAFDNEPFTSYQLTVYKSDFSTPAWLHNAAVYQIFPDRFRNGDITNDWCRSGSTTGCPSLYGAPTSSNIIHTTWNEAMRDPRQPPVDNNAYGSQFYGGDLKGVEDKLDYIKNLGFDTIYFTPIFAGRSNHGYDADNFLQIAPQLGGDAAFTSLKTAADTRGMKIILDGVWNHVSQDSMYMDYFNRYPGANGGCESFSSPYRNWFIWNSNATSVPCLWTHYNGWFGFGGLPELTEGPQIRDFFYRTPTTNVTQYWLDRGVNGWRFDVADNISHDWWKDYRPYAKTYKADAPLIGEVWYDSSAFLLGDQLDSVMNYRFRKNVLGFARGANWSDNDNSGSNQIIGITPSQFNRAMMSIREDYPLPAQLAMLNLLSSHDTNRPLYVLKNSFETQAEAKQRLKLAALFQFTYIGAPMVYYGDEAGINSPSLANSGSGQPEDDPYNRAPYPWDDESGNTNVYGPADADLISFYTKLGTIRKESVALRTGTFQELLMGDITPSATDNNTYAFARVSGAQKIIVVMNNGTGANTATIPVGAYFADGTVLTDRLDNTSLMANHTVTGGNVTVTLPARSGAILAVNAPTSAQVDVGGRIMRADGTGIGKATITLTDEAGNTRTTRSSSLGFYKFAEVPTGQTYIVSVSNKVYEFTPQTVNVNAAIGDLNFIAK